MSFLRLAWTNQVNPLNVGRCSRGKDNGRLPSVQDCHLMFSSFPSENSECGLLKDPSSFWMFLQILAISLKQKEEGKAKSHTLSLWCHKQAAFFSRMRFSSGDFALFVARWDD